MQLAHAARYLERARSLCDRFQVRSCRALALMFDIVVQNGSIAPEVAARIQADVDALDRGLDAEAREHAILRIVANRRADAANPRWIEDVRERKLCIANGGGHVHGAFYDLAEYGLGLGRPEVASRSPAEAGHDVRSQPSPSPRAGPAKAGRHVRESAKAGRHIRESAKAGRHARGVTRRRAVRSLQSKAARASPSPARSGRKRR